MRNIFLIILSIMMLAGVCSASSPSHPKLHIEGGISIDGDYKNGAEFNIVMTFTLIPDGHSYRILQEQQEILNKRVLEGDSASLLIKEMTDAQIDIAYIIPDSNIEFLSQQIWKGKLEPNIENVFTIRVMLKEDFQTEIHGVVASHCNPENLAENVYPPCFSTNGIEPVLLNEGLIPEPSVKSDTTIYYESGSSVNIKRSIEIPPGIIELPKTDSIKSSILNPPKKDSADSSLFFSQKTSTFSMYMG
ncbi:MAG: hypothetical protein ABIE07_01975 [Candidatus Zixiibacteriota bacterium]